MWTKEDQREAIREHYRNNKQYYKDKAKKRRQEIVKWYKDYKNGIICLICNESDPRCLDFHHRNPRTKKHDVSQMVWKGKSIKEILKEIEKCDPLCSNCHRKETIV